MFHRRVWYSIRAEYNGISIFGWTLNSKIYCNHFQTHELSIWISEKYEINHSGTGTRIVKFLSINSFLDVVGFSGSVVVRSLVTDYIWLGAWRHQPCKLWMRETEIFFFSVWLIHHSFPLSQKQNFFFLFFLLTGSWGTAQNNECLFMKFSSNIYRRQSENDSE